MLLHAEELPFLLEPELEEIIEENLYAKSFLTNTTR